MYTAYDDKKDKYKNWFDYGYGSFIYKNRYAISTNGSVYDLNKKSLILDSGDDFVKINGDSVFFYHNNYKGIGLWAFNLKTRNYVLLNRDKIDKDKKWSPDYKSYIKVLRTKTAFQISLCKNGVSSPILIDVTAAYIARFFFTKKIETCWLNKISFLYASHTNTFPPLPKLVPELIERSTTDTIKTYDFTPRDDASTKVTIFKYNINTQKSEKIAEIDSITHSFKNGQFSKDEKKELIYITTNGVFNQLNLRSKKMTPYPYTALKHGFSVENKYNRGGQILKYHGL
ncbi:MAG TPA: hypothetical protein VJ304_00030, partial [Flavobacterium sp.]|nr:hypothetical protein [Flavobacterium sp.]